MIRFTIIFLIGLLWSCANHTAPDETQTKKSQGSKDTVLTEKVDSLPAGKLEKLLGIQARQKLKYSGRYSYKMTSTGDKKLHGPFYFAYSDSSATSNKATNEYDRISVLKVRYSGQFENGKKEGHFTEQLLHNDGVDLFSKWTVTINFKDNQCTSGTFTGTIGHIMPETTLRYDILDTCTFNFVVDQAWAEWKKEWERQNNK